MEEDYGNQINGLKDQIKEKIEIINKLMEDQETVTTVPAPSSRVFRKDFLEIHEPEISSHPYKYCFYENPKSSNENNSSSSKSKSLTHWKQLNQRNEKIISQVRHWVQSLLLTVILVKT